jgi:two-component system sensor histidine kinase/response regulator
MFSRSWRNLSLRAKGLLVVVLPIVALVASLSMFYVVRREEQSAQQWVEHTLEVRDKIQLTHTHLEEAETRLRGYFLTGDQDFLTYSSHSNQELARIVGQLQKLVRDNQEQSERIQRLSGLIQRKQSHMSQIVVRQRPLAGNEPLALAINQSHQLMEQLRRELAVMRQEEERLTVQRTQHAERIRFWLHAVMLSGLLVGLVGGVSASLFFTLGIDRRVHRLEKSASILAQGQPIPSVPIEGHDAIDNLSRALERASQLLIERERKLHDSNQYLNHLLTAMPGALVRLDPNNFRVLYVSPNATRVLGYSVEEMTEAPDFYARTMHPDDREITKVEIAQGILEKAGVIETERRVRHKDGHYLWMHSHVSPEYDEQGNVVSLLAYALDVSERKQTEEILREQESRFRNSFDFAPIGIGLCSLDGQWRQVNYALCHILGYSEGELLQTHAQDLSHPDDKELMREKMKHLIAGEIPSFQCEKRYIHRHGHVVWAQISMSLVSNSKGEPAYYIAQIQDITERKRFEIELAQARDAAVASVDVKASFMANMSHEIRTPMNGIVGMIDLLQTTNLNQQQRDFIETLRESADALLVIINDILDFSKIEAGKMVMSNEDFDLSSVVESSVSLLAPRAQERGLEIASLIYHDVPALLRGDAGRLRQVLLNLLGNAIKFTEEGETMLRITRAIETETHVTLRFSVHDSGIGMSEEAQKRLFLPFAQVDGTTTRRFGGTGLGLAISKQIVEMMGGQIGVRSQEGQGSTFWFTARFEKQRHPDALAAREIVDMSNWRVLVVDSNVAHRQIVQQQVASWSFRNDGAPTGSAAVKMLHEEAQKGDPYHIVLLNTPLQDMDALTLVRTIRAQAAIAATRLVVMISSGDDVHNVRNAGADDALDKPIRQSQLFNCLNHVMESGQTLSAVPTKPQPKYFTQAPEPAGRSLRVLVAEDNAINQAVVLNQLQNLGHQAVVVDDGRAALDSWQQSTFDLILMDCQMPRLDGYAASRELRRREAAEQHIPIIALTANALEGDRERCLAAGMDDYLSKPFKQHDLAAVLERWASTNNEVDKAEVNDNQETIMEPSLYEARLNELQSELKPERFQQLVNLFLQQIPQQLDELHEALAARDANTLVQASHKLKGSSATLGASRMAALCSDMQHHAEQHNVDAIVPLMEELEHDAVIVQSRLARYLD